MTALSALSGVISGAGEAQTRDQRIVEMVIAPLLVNACYRLSYNIFDR
jgi:hypothetical protein